MKGKQKEPLTPYDLKPGELTPYEREQLEKQRNPCKHKNERKITERSIFFDDYVCADCGEYLRREWVK